MNLARRLYAISARPREGVLQALGRHGVRAVAGDLDVRFAGRVRAREKEREVFGDELFARRKSCEPGKRSTVAPTRSRAVRGSVRQGRP